MLKIQQCRSINLNLDNAYDYTCAKSNLITNNWMAQICSIWCPNVMVFFFWPQRNMCKMPPSWWWRSFPKIYKTKACYRVHPLLHQRFIEVLTMCKVTSLASSLSFFSNCHLFHFSHVFFVLCFISILCFFPFIACVSLFFVYIGTW